MANAVELFEEILSDAHQAGASDIHINPDDSGSCVLLRVDGALRQRGRVPAALCRELVARIKVLARLRLDEHYMAQDGRLQLALGQETLDVRVSVVPTFWGERAVLRLLGAAARAATLESLGFGEADAARITEALGRRSGMLLATGPTGSGKTTTLYTMVSMLRKDEISIVTIEDPVECAMPGVVQIPAQPSRGLNFGSGLRSIVRQDPDIIMVGEIRDAETAGIATQAALTGHLLLSSLHTASAAATLPRLIDMGVDAYLVAATAEAAIGQRLVRRLCQSCKRERAATEREARLLGAVGPRSRTTRAVFEGAGCEACDYTGYRGRVCLSEVLLVDASLRDAIAAAQPAAQLEDLARRRGMTTLFEDGLHKARCGTTTLQEVLCSVNER